MIRWISCNTCSTVNCHYIVICEFHLLFSLIIASSVSIIVYNGYNPVYLDFASNIIYHRSLSISCKTLNLDIDQIAMFEDFQAILM